MEEQTRKSSSDTSPAECNWKNGKEKRRTSILKPPKLRTPLKVLQLTSAEEFKDDTTARPSRRVSFGHFQVRKFGYENGVVCDSVYSFESSKSESSSQANNSVGEYNEVTATNSSHNCKNTLPESTNCKKDPHMKYKCTETDDKSNVTDIGVCSPKMMVLKKKTDDSPGFSATDIAPHKNSSDLANYKNFGARTDYKDHYYLQKENFMGPNSVVLDEMQSVHEQDDIKQLCSLTKCGREHCEQKNETEADHCEHHLNSATVTDMELADSYSFGHIEYKEESSLDRKRKKSVDTTEKSFRFAAESDMELTKVIDTVCCREVLNEGKDKSISLNQSRAKNNLISSSDCHISKNAMDCNSIQNINQQLNATKRFSTNNGMDITEGCGIIDSCSHSDIPNDGMADEVNSHVLSISRLSMDEEDGDRNEEKTSRYSTKYLNPVDIFEKSFINESMDETVAVGCVLGESDTDYRDTIKDFERNKSVSCHLEYSNDNFFPVNGEKCSSVRAATTLPNEDKLTDRIEKCRENNPDDTNNFNTSKTMLMCVDMQLTRNTCHNDQDIPVNAEKCSSVTAATTLHNEDKLTDHIEKCTENNPDDTNNFNTSKTMLMCVDRQLTRNTCHIDQDNSFMQFTRVVEGNIQERSMQDSRISLGNKVSSYTEHFNIEKKNESVMEKTKLKHDMDFTEIQSPLCDNRSVAEVVATERQTDVSITATSSKIILCNDKQNDFVSSHILDTKSNHPLILKPHANKKDSSDYALSEKNNHAVYCKERCEVSISKSTKQTEHSHDRSVKCTSPCQTLDKNFKICTVSSTSPELKSEVIRQGKQVNDVGRSMCRAPNNCSVIQDNLEFCVAPISEKENIPNNRDSTSKVLLKFSECQPYCSNRSELHHLPTQAVEDHLVTDNKTRCALGNGMSSKKRRSSENEEIREDTKFRKKQYIATDHISDKQHLQTTTEPSGLTVETKAFSDRDATAALCVNAGAMDTAVSERPAPKIVGALSDTNSVQVNNKMSFLETDITNVSLPQPSDPNSKLNFSCPAKTIVFNNLSDCGLEFTCCETSSASIEAADCKNNLHGSTLVTDKRDTDSPLREKQVLKRITNDGDVFGRSETSGQKKDTRHSEEVSSTTGTPTNISEVNLPRVLLREDKNSQHIEDSGVLHRNSSAPIDGDKNNPFSAPESNDQPTVTFRRRRRYESTVASLSFMEKDIKTRDYCTETDKNKDKAVVINNPELSRDTGETAALSQSSYDESLTSVKEGQTVEGMKILNSSGNECSFYIADEAIHNADKTFHSWYCNKKASIVNEDGALSADKINLSNSCHNTSGTSASFPTQAPEVANKDLRLDYLPSMNEEIGQNVTQDRNSLDFKMSDGYLNTEVQLAQAKEKISAVQVDSTSNYLIKNREKDSFSESSAIIYCDAECLKQSVQENGNSTFGKEMENKQFSYNDPVERPDAHVDVLNVTSETVSLDPKEKCHAVRNLMEASRPVDASRPMEASRPMQANIPCEADPSYSNAKSQITPKTVQDFCSVTAEGGFPVIQGTELDTLSVDRAQDVPTVALSAREYSTAVSPPMKYIRHCSRSVSTTRDHTSTAESPKIGVSVDGIEDMGGSPIFWGGRQNSKCDSFSNEVAVHSEALDTAAKKMSNMAGKQDIIVVKIQEEKLTIPVENKCKKVENIIISQAERSEVLWNIRAMTQCQWIFTFLNDTLRLYIHFDKPAEVGTIQELNLISYLTGKADEDAKFVHFVLLKKFSQARLKSLCEVIDEVPELLEKISVDVHRMVTFLYEFQKVQLLYNMEMFGTSVSFNIRSYKLVIWFKINIDLSNWEQILEDSITISHKFGHVNETEVKNLANGVEKNPYFLRNYFKAVQQYMKILERFGC